VIYVYKSPEIKAKRVFTWYIYREGYRGVPQTTKLRRKLEIYNKKKTKKTPTRWL
jgi:tRNA U54 and U55 pseudouridine synthase Pus10